MSTKSDMVKKTISSLKEVCSNLSGPISSACEVYDLYYSASMIKDGKSVELGFEKAGNFVGKGIGSIIGGSIGTFFCPVGGTLVGSQIGGMVGSFLSGKSFRFFGEILNNNY